MAITVKQQPPTNQYILVVAGTSNEFFLQNVSRNRKASCSIVWGTSVPAADTVGHILEVGDGVVRNSMTGNLYARGLTTDVVLAVTEE